MKDATTDELMIHCLSREVRDGEISATGTLSPLPAAACYLARLSHAPSARLLIFHSPDWPFPGELEGLFDLAQQGRLGLFFLSGAQIDRRANINLIAIGDYDRPRVRLPGGAGSAMLYLESGRSCLFVRHQSARSLVEKVDFVTAPGGGPTEDRRGGPCRLVTDLAVFDYTPDKGLVPASIHPGIAPGDLQDATGWDMGDIFSLSVTRGPDPETLALIRGPVRDLLTPVYPAFAAKLGAG